MAEGAWMQRQPRRGAAAPCSSDLFAHRNEGLEQPMKWLVQPGRVGVYFFFVKYITYKVLEMSSVFIQVLGSCVYAFKQLIFHGIKASKKLAFTY